MKKEMSVGTLKAKIDDGIEVKLLDVREPYEHDEYNIGGTLIPLGDLMKKSEELSDWKEDLVVVYCRSGNRSRMAQNLLQAKGFKDIWNLTGGMLDWAEKFE